VKPASAISGKKQPFVYRLRKNVWIHWELYLLILPAFAYFIIFHYVPIYGVQIAFRDYLPGIGFLQSPWVGMEHFRRFFNTFASRVIIRNTLTISLAQLIFGTPFPVILALMLNLLRQRRFKSLVQTVSYAPFFISNVAMAGMILVLLSNMGFANNILRLLGREPVHFMGRADLFVPIFVTSNIWKGTGFGSIIYLAVLSKVDMDLYEAAKIDGASRLRMVWHIDLPCILPTLVILLIMNAGRIMSVGFEQVLLLQNTMNLSASEIISTYTYKMGLLNRDFSFAAAIGLFNNVVNIVLLYLVNWVARKFSETSLW
jgi:putative aldouronate transport system permease protein